MLSAIGMPAKNESRWRQLLKFSTENVKFSNGQLLPTSIDRFNFKLKC
jgi:hypothetical protein